MVVNCNAGADRSVTMVTGFLYRYKDHEIIKKYKLPCGSFSIIEILFFLKSIRIESMVQKIEKVLGNYEP